MSGFFIRYYGVVATGPSSGSWRAEALEVGIALQGVSGCHAASSSITCITGDLSLWGLETAEYQAFQTPLINHFGRATLKATQEPFSLAMATEVAN